MRDFPPLYDYEALINRWSAGFGELAIQLRIFQQAQLIGGNVVADFSESQLGLLIEQDDQRNSNVSLSLVAQLALMMFNHAMGLEARLHVSKHRRELAQYLEKSCPGCRRQTITVRAIAFYEFFKEGNSRLASLYFQRSQLFDEEFDDYPEHELEADTELAASLLREVLFESFFRCKDFADETEDLCLRCRTMELKVTRHRFIGQRRGHHSALVNITTVVVGIGGSLRVLPIDAQSSAMPKPQHEADEARPIRKEVKKRSNGAQERVIFSNEVLPQ